MPNKKIYLILFLLFFICLVSGCAKKETQNNDAKNSNNEMYLGQQTSGAEQREKLCGWVDRSDIIIKVNFAEGVAKDTSYETGFYFSPIYSIMKLARAGCDYRVGFNFSEFKNKGAAEVGVRGYSNNLRRQIEGQPISLVFDAEGKPSIGNQIEVLIKN